MNKSGCHNKENVDPNAYNKSYTKKFVSRSSGKSLEPWSANTGEQSHTTAEEVEISCFFTGSRVSSLSPNQALLCGIQLETYLSSKIICDVFSYLDEFDDLEWVRSGQLTYLIELIAKDRRDCIGERIVQLTSIFCAKRITLSRSLVKMLFGVCSRVSQPDGVRVLEEVDELLSSYVQTADLHILLPLIMYSHCHQLLHWGLVEDTWIVFKQKTLCESIKEEWEKTAIKVSELLLRAAIDRGMVNLIEEVLSRMKIQTSDVFFNKLIDYAFKAHQVEMAEMIFDYMKITTAPTIVTINTLIDQYFKNNLKERAWQMFELLKASSIKPDNFTYTTLINGLKNNREGLDLNLAFTLFDEYKLVNTPDQIIYNCLLDACINAGDLTRAFTLLDEMKRTHQTLDEITYNTLIKGCGRKKKLNEAIQLFEEMKSQGITPNRISFNSLLDSCVKCNRMNIAWRYFEEMRKHYGIFPDNFTYSILVNGIKTNHSNRDELLKAISLLDQIQEAGSFQPDEILYNSLIDACVKFNEIQKALQLFKEMKTKQIEPSSVTYGILIKAYGKMNDLNGAFLTFQEMKNKQININDVTYGCLIDACVRNDRLDRALVIIEQMKKDNIPVNTVLYTTLIKGYCKLNQTDKAIINFEQMKSDPRTCPNLITYNSLLDGLVKNSQLAEADRLFQELSNHPTLKPDLITFSTLLKGYSRKGNMKKINEAVHIMLENKIVPDESLLSLILDSCGQQKYVSEYELDTQQICRNFLARNNRQRQEPLNQQFGQVFLNCNKQQHHSPNKENKENYNSKNELSAYLATQSRKKKY